MEKKELERQIEKVIEELPVQCREILLLRMEGFSYQEITKELSITEGTVCKQINIAKTKLRKRFENER